MNCQERIERTRWVRKFKSDPEIAEVVSVTPQVISNNKKRVELSSALMLKFANIYGLSVDWHMASDGESMGKELSTVP